MDADQHCDQAQNPQGKFMMIDQLLFMSMLFSFGLGLAIWGISLVEKCRVCSVFLLVFGSAIGGYSMGMILKFAIIGG